MFIAEFMIAPPYDFPVFNHMVVDPVYQFLHCADPFIHKRYLSLRNQYITCKAIFLYMSWDNFMPIFTRPVFCCAVKTGSKVFMFFRYNYAVLLTEIITPDRREQRA